MNDGREFGPPARDLMELHVEALFTQDRNGRLVGINEPWPGAARAPRFFMGRALEGAAICRFRHDVPEPLVRRLKERVADEPTPQDFRTKPRHFEAYMNLLQGERFTMGPCYLVPDGTAPSAQTVPVTRENAAELSRGGFEWLASEVDYAQPCVALVRDGRAVSVCRSVRMTSKAHEAGLDTLEPYRGRGYAAEAVAGWAVEVRQAGGLPLYSTAWENKASQSVAKKASLAFYGANFIVV